MKDTCFALVFGLLSAMAMSAPPPQCDEVPRAMTAPQAPFTRTGTSSEDSCTPITEPTRRQRIQNLKDRIGELKWKFETPPPPPPRDVDEEPPLLIEPPAAAQEASLSDPPTPSASPMTAKSLDLVEVEPAPPPQPVQTPEAAILPELVPEPEPHLVPEPQPQPVVEPVLQPVPESLPLPAPQATLEQTPPESPRSLPAAPSSAVPIPSPAAADVLPSREGSPLTLPTELLDQAIDRQRMGNNLYAIGAYDLALMDYEMMLRQPLDKVEAQWVSFQVANCHRHLGQMAEAQKAYRRVAGETSEEWLGQMSRWWLKELDDREQLQRRVVELDQVIKTLEQEVNRGP
jgi:hypothetical protein